MHRSWGAVPRSLQNTGTVTPDAESNEGRANSARAPCTAARLLSAGGGPTERDKATKEES